MRVRHCPASVEKTFAVMHMSHNEAGYKDSLPEESELTEHCGYQKLGIQGAGRVPETGSLLCQSEEDCLRV